MKNYQLLFEDEEFMNDAIVTEMFTNPQEAPYILKALGATKTYYLEQLIKGVINQFSLKEVNEQLLETSILKDANEHFLEIAINLVNNLSKTAKNAKWEVKLVLNPIPTDEYSQAGKKRDIYELIIRAGEKEFTVGKMTDCFYALEKFLPEIETAERKDKCHIFSVILADTLANLDVNVDVVTGYVYHLTDQTKFLHSWVESKKGIVFDATLNAFMDKELYQKLQHYEEVSRFSGKTVVKDFERLSERINTPGEGLDIKEFLTFGHELINATDKFEKTK